MRNIKKILERENFCLITFSQSIVVSIPQSKYDVYFFYFISKHVAFCR